MRTISRILIGLTFFISIQTLTSHAETNTYQIDPTHSSVWFRVLHLNISPAYGAFGDISGTIQFNAENTDKSSIEVTIKTASVNTLNDKRDEHLRSADFFNVEQFPEAKFKSNSWERTDENRYRIKGVLTLLGVDKPIEFEARLVGSGKGRNNEDRLGFEAVFTIKRSDFGMVKYLPSQIGDEVSITVGIEAEKVTK
ncbi:MAG TPA: YceI family protein [Candidatus Hydrogenedens sp.]|nr:YceI family protein [Candidatus Hydrogenedens sp.]